MIKNICLFMRPFIKIADKKSKERSDVYFESSMQFSKTSHEKSPDLQLFTPDTTSGIC